MSYTAHNRDDFYVSEIFLDKRNNCLKKYKYSCPDKFYAKSSRFLPGKKFS